MGFWYALVDQLWSARTPFLILTFIVVKWLLARTPQVQRSHMRAAGTLVFGHLVAVVVAAGQIATDYIPTIAEVTALAFLLLGFVSLGSTTAFRALLPRAGIVMPRILIDLITAVGVVVVFIVVGNRAGFSIAGLITTSAVLTAVIGFSLQDTLGNVMGGLSVQLDKSVMVGDWIQIGDDTGRVTEIRWRYTAIETRAWETVIIPNGTLVKSKVTILGRRTDMPLLLRRHIDFFVDFRFPPTDVIEAVETALRSDLVPRMAPDPAPQVLFIGIKESYANYCIRYWLDDLSCDDPTDSAVRVRMWFALRRAKIPLSIPAQSLFLTQESPERTARKAEGELGRRMAALTSVDLFRGLSEEVRKILAERLAFTPFTAGESVTREGDRDDGLYMIVSGEAAVRIGTGRLEREVARLRAGQFFGEMSLMTGEARSASVIAIEDLTCYRIDKPAFELLLRETPAIADQIADVLAVRRGALTTARDEQEDVTRTRIENVKQDLVGRIRAFFKID